MSKYSLVLVVSLILFWGCGGNGSTPSSLTNLNTDHEYSDIKQRLIDDFGFSGASNIATMDRDIVAFTYYKDGNKHFVIFNLQEGEKLSEQVDFMGDSVSSNTDDSITYQNGTTVVVDSTNNTKKPVITTYPDSSSNAQEKKSAKQYIREYYENDGSDWTSMESFTYSSDNHADAAVVVISNHSWNFYIYDIPSHGNPYIAHTINPPLSGDEWTNIYNVRRIGGGKITFTGQSKGAGRENYTYYYLDHYYE